MAKKRKKEVAEDSYEFKMPEFDETEYLRKEVRESKTLVVSFIYAVVISIISFGLMFVDVALAVLVGVIAIFFLGYIFRIIKIDTSTLEKKQWGSNIMIYIFTWLVIWVVLTNPPFSDFQGPVINEDGIYFGNEGNWTRLTEKNKMNLTFEMNISFNVTVYDNVKVDSSSVHIIINENGNEIVDAPMESVGKNKYRYVLDDLEQDRIYNFKITAKDINDHGVSVKGLVRVF